MFGTCLPRRGRPFTHQVARSGSAIQSQTRSRELRLHPAEGMPRRRRFDVGGSGLSGRWSLPVPSPAPSHRLTKREATRAASAPRASARPDGSGPTPWRVVWLPLVLPQPSLLIVQEIAGDVDGSHRPGFARQPTEIRIVLVALRAAMGIVRLPQELPAMTNLFGAQSPTASTVPADPESRFSFTQEAPFAYAAR